MDLVLDKEELDTVVLQKIKGIFKKYNCINKYGICLLHKHFDFSDREILVAFNHSDKNRVTLEVLSESDRTLTMVECMWKFSSSSDESFYYPVQWYCTENIQNINEFISGDVEIFNEVKEVLKEYSYLDRFGIYLIVDDILVRNDEMSVEYTDVESRISEIGVYPLRSKEEGSLETRWKLSDSVRVVAICRLYCNYENYAHVQRHATVN